MSGAALDHVVSALSEEYFRRHPKEAALEISSLDTDDISDILTSSPPQRAIDIWERLPIDLAAMQLKRLPAGVTTLLLSRADAIVAARILASLDQDRRETLLQSLGALRERELRALLKYPEDTAGTLMDTRVNVIPATLTVRETLRSLRRSRAGIGQHIYVSDPDGRLIGQVTLQDLAFADANTALDALMRPLSVAVLPMDSRDVVIERFEKYKMTDLPVIDLGQRLLGIIHHQTLIAAVQAESSADILSMVGVSRDERAFSPVRFVIRKRLPWLQINLLTAFLAAAVVGLFENTIAQFTALAVLLPVVAGQSGNTGAQSLAVTMRALALHEVSVSHWWRVSRKELAAGAINGVAISLTTSAGVYLWSGSSGLALVISVSMVMSMVIAAFVGVIIPMVLSAAGQDPAQSSSIILTTVTDVAGFFSFLGIATMLSFAL